MKSKLIPQPPGFRLINLNSVLLLEEGNKKRKLPRAGLFKISNLMEQITVVAASLTLKIFIMLQKNM